VKLALAANDFSQERAEVLGQAVACAGRHEADATIEIPA
jgi:hypothetical protein